MGERFGKEMDCICVQMSNISIGYTPYDDNLKIISYDVFNK